MIRPQKTNRNFIRSSALSTAFAAAAALSITSTADASEFLAAQSLGGTTQSELVLRVEGLQTNSGQLMVGLYDTEQGFENEIELMGRTAPIDGTTTEIIFEGLPVGDYALKVFHDEDSDGELDTGALGIPSEPYGFSNNASDPFSAPEWDETHFTLPRGRMTQTIDLD